MFHYYGNIHVYSPGAGADNPPGAKIFHSVHLPIPSKFYPLNSILSFFPIQMHWRPKLTLPKVGQGHRRVMIYINFVELLSVMLHAKFQIHRPSGSGEDF